MQHGNSQSLPHRRSLTPRKGLVEDALALPVALLLEATTPSLLVPGVCRILDSPSGALSIMLTACAGRRDAVSLSYTRDGVTVDYSLDLVRVPQFLGGHRWLVRCPLRAADGEDCQRTARTLYLPASRRYFACRRCHGLTYRSTQAPVASRLRSLSTTLGIFERMLDAENPHGSLAAIEGARLTLHSFLTGIEFRDSTDEVERA